LEERKGNIYRYPYIDLHIAEKSREEKSSEKEIKKGISVACRQGRHIDKGSYLFQRRKERTKAW
jgi:hypothetical protein